MDDEDDRVGAAVVVMLYSRRDDARGKAITRAAGAANEGRSSPELTRALSALASAAAEVPGITEPIDPQAVHAAEEAVLVAWESQLS